MKLELLLTIAGALQLSLLVAGVAMTRVTGMDVETSRLSPFHRQLFWVYLVFVGFTLTVGNAGMFVFALKFRSQLMPPSAPMYTPGDGDCA